MKSTKKNSHRNSYRLGRLAETIAANTLVSLGCCMVEKVQPARTQSGIYLKQCSGDFRAVLPPHGKSVLVEVKYRARGNLRPSDLKDHQWRALREHAQCGGVSLIMFFDGAKMHVHNVDCNGGISEVYS